MELPHPLPCLFPFSFFTCQCHTLVKVTVVGNSQAASLQTVTAAVSKLAFFYLQVVCQDIEFVCIANNPVEVEEYGRKQAPAKEVCTHADQDYELGVELD